MKQLDLDAIVSDRKIWMAQKMAENFLKLPGGDFLNLSVIACLARTGLDGSATAITTGGAQINLLARDARVVKALLDRNALEILAPEQSQLSQGLMQGKEK